MNRMNRFQKLWKMGMLFFLLLSGLCILKFAMFSDGDKTPRTIHFKEVFQLTDEKLREWQHEIDPSWKYVIVKDVSEEDFLKQKKELQSHGFVSWKTQKAEQGFVLATNEKNIISLGKHPHLITYSEYADPRRGGFPNMFLYDYQTKTMYFVFVTDFGG